MVPGFAWPGVAFGRAAELAGLLFRLDDSQWWPADRLRAKQLQQLHVLLTHAAKHVPFYRKRLLEAGFDPATPVDETVWQRLATLTRQEVQTRAARLRASFVHPAHGAITEAASGGSTGVPVRVRRTETDALMLHAQAIRQESWHRDWPLEPIAALRNVPPGLSGEQVRAMTEGDGLTLPDQGGPHAALHETGPAHLFLYNRPAHEQAAFLQRVRPDYVTTLPSNLRLLLHHLREAGIALSGTRAVWTSSEVVDPPLRELCREVLQCPIVTEYSAHETGFIAIQCPQHEHLHVCSETILVEVLDEANRPCPPGTVGRVVVTPLHAVAMPLIRYELGDRAELGPPCACGRGLPVLRRIVGRTYETIVMKDGTRRFMGIGYGLAKLTAIREFQLAQIEPGAIEVRLVTSRRLTEDEASQAVAAVAERTGPEVVITLTYRDHIPRTEAGKLRPFVSELPG